MEVQTPLKGFWMLGGSLVRLLWFDVLGTRVGSVPIDVLMDYLLQLFVCQFFALVMMAIKRIILDLWRGKL